jgi:glycosyltransferase involved in cell wall biosynthesis
LYLDIRDIFVDTIKDVLPRKLAWAMKPIFSLIEKWTLNRAAKVNLVSEGFKDYFKGRYPQVPLSFYTNGIDEEFLGQPITSTDSAEEQIPVVVYAGNIGEGQGLHNIIPPLAKRLEGKLRFKIIGDGGRRAQLVQSLERAAVNNVEVLSPVGRAELIEAYRAADVLFMHLNDYDAFLKVLPSKVFEYAALGKPIWAGVAGYAASFVDQNVDNAAVFNPCDVDGAVSAFGNLSLATAPRNDFIERFARANIMREMAADILNTVGTQKV